MKMKKIIASLLIITAIMPMSGCTKGGALFGSYRDIAQMQIIETVGVDSEDGGITVTMSSRGGGDKAVIVSRTGASITEAMDDAQEYSGKEYLFYEHASNIVIGQDTAESGLAGILDYIERSPSMLLGVELYVVKGDTAKALLTEPSVGDGGVSETLNTLKLLVEQKGRSAALSCGETAGNLASSGSSLICAVELVPADDVVEDGKPSAGKGGKSDEAGEESGESESSGETTGMAEEGGGDPPGENSSQGAVVVSAGYGVIKDARLVCFIEGDTARGVNVLLGKLGGGAITLDTPSYGTAALSPGKCEMKYEPLWDKDGGLSGIAVNIKLQAGLVSSGNTADAIDGAYLSALEDELGRTVTGWVSEALELSVREGADFLSLGAMARRDDPVKFSQIDWPSTFENMKFEISTESVIERTFDMKGRADSTGGGKDNVRNK